MSLSDLLSKNNAGKHEQIEITEDVVAQHQEKIRMLISYWRMYPDRFIDYLCSLNPKNTFHFFFYQRLFLRVAMRHQYVYATFVRAWSKSFMSVLCLMIKAILYPGAKLFVVSGGKEQSASILSSKVQELCKLIPALEHEIIWDTRGTKARTSQTKDSVVYTFKNGSTLENVAARESTRGRRFQAGLMEECVGIDQDILEQVIIPTMNVSRMVNGEIDENEKLNQSQVYVTTAGYKNTFAYQKLIQFLCQMAARPKNTMILGGSWRVPVVEGLLSKSFVKDLQMDGTFNEASFEREYESKWTGDVESAFFDSELFNKSRTLNLAESKHNGRTNKNGYYILGVDVGRTGCTTEIVVIKVTPAATGVPLKQVVNIYSLDEEDFITQAKKIKEIFKRFHCQAAVVDGNGLGAGLVDLLVVDYIDPDTDELWAGFGVINDDDNRYKYAKTENTIYNALYIMKANQALNSDMYAYCEHQIRNNKMRFLIDENVAKNKLMSQAQGQKMSAVKRAEHLLPYTQTTILRDQMANLVNESDGANIILKPYSRKIKHDKVSALIYGLYYCKLEEEKLRKRKKRDLSKLILFN